MTPDRNPFKNVGCGVVGVLAVADVTDAEVNIVAAVDDSADGVGLAADVVSADRGRVSSSGVPDSGVFSEVVVLVDISAGVATMRDVSLDRSRSVVSVPCSDGGEVPLSSLTELVGFSVSVAGSGAGGDVVDSDSWGSSSPLESVGGSFSADVEPEELDDAFDRSGEFAGSDVALEADEADVFADFAPVADPESVDPAFADEAPEDADWPSSASAIPGLLATAAPMPSATAKPPTLPMNRP